MTTFRGGAKSNQVDIIRSLLKTNTVEIGTGESIEDRRAKARLNPTERCPGCLMDCEIRRVEKEFWANLDPEASQRPPIYTKDTCPKLEDREAVGLKKKRSFGIKRRRR